MNVVVFPGFCTFCIAAEACCQQGTFEKDSELTHPFGKRLASARNSGPCRRDERKSFVTSLCLISAAFLLLAGAC